MELENDERGKSILRRMGRDENGNWYYHDLTDRSRSLSTSLVLAVSDVIGDGIHSIKPPLNEIIDPDALDALFHTPEGSRAEGASSVSLRYAGLDVTLYSDGWICIAE